jgi:tellurite resistance-related uncharacterized protein
VSAPYRTTKVFDAVTLPRAITEEHRTKAGVWGIVRVLEGALTYRVLSPPSETRISPTRPGRVLPEQPHRLEPDPGASFRLQIEFYDHEPEVE